MSLNTDLLDMASSLVTDLGKTATILIPGNKRYIPRLGKSLDSDTTSVTVKISPPRITKTLNLNGTELTTTTILLPAKNLTFSVDIARQITIDSITYKIEGYEPIYGGESIVAYELTISR